MARQAEQEHQKQHVMGHPDAVCVGSRVEVVCNRGAMHSVCVGWGGVMGFCVSHAQTGGGGGIGCVCVCVCACVLLGGDGLSFWTLREHEGSVVSHVRRERGNDATHLVISSALQFMQFRCAVPQDRALLHSSRKNSFVAAYCSAALSCLG